MKTLRNILLAALLALSITGSAWASPWDDKLVFVASRIPECQASMEIVEAPRWNGGFVGPEMGRLLGYPGAALRVWSPNTGSPWVTAILLHEIGHCAQQAQDHMYYVAEVKDSEFDADRRSIEYLVQLSERPENMLDLLIFLQQAYRIPANLPTDHGSFNERALHAQHIVRKATSPESP